MYTKFNLLLIIVVPTFFSYYTNAGIGDLCVNDGRNILKDCNTCQCVNGFLSNCTKFRCDLSGPNSSLYITCVESEVKTNEKCQTCICQNDSWVCEGKTCAEIRENSRIAREVICLEEEVKGDICNECRCTDGKWVCSQKCDRILKEKQIEVEEFFGQAEITDQMPPCVRIDQFTFHCNSSMVAPPTSFNQNHSFHIPEQ